MGTSSFIDDVPLGPLVPSEQQQPTVFDPRSDSTNAPGHQHQEVCAALS